jgi:glutamate synthase (NADPH) small chain
MPMLAVEERTSGCAEVALGLPLEDALVEARRCLDCKDPKCIDACPLHIDIKGFIALLVENNLEGALEKLSERSAFPSICGRVCQHEMYCEKACLLGKKLEPVGIGNLERFVADFGWVDRPMHRPATNGRSVAMVGSGPASLIAAHDLALKGYRVVVFEALHELGGVLAYGIPPFRLPRAVLHAQIDRLLGCGVEFHTGVIVGKTISLQDLLDQGFSAVFVGTGAGLPHMMKIPGENLTGVYTANEFLTRLNLMQADRFPKTDTPIHVGLRTVVVGGGNSAMDAARWARRMGSETTVLFRRGRSEMRAREEEIDHAGDEGVRFEFLAAPVRLIGDENGAVRAIECVRMELGEPDESGRPAPIPVFGSEFLIECNTVVAAVGQSPNPILTRVTPDLKTERGKVVITEDAQTSMPLVFAGGDAVRGGSTVILAMRDGRAAAEAIDRVLQDQACSTTAAFEPASNRVADRRLLATDITWLELEAPDIARRWKPGQFLILQPSRESERIPITILDGDVSRGTIQVVVQSLGKTSRLVSSKEPGERFQSVTGPLGEPAEIERVGHVVCIGGGVGVAELLPLARALRAAGNRVTALCGARSRSLIVLAEEIQAVCDEVLWATDDGSSGFAGNVGELLRAWRETLDKAPDQVRVIGPLPMMRAIAEITRGWGIRTLASLNPIMVDGTGMCGGCRVSVEGKARFACVEGPEFDAHQVDYNELSRRNQTYREMEKISLRLHETEVRA